MREVRTFHGVFRETDLEASETETVDLIAMFASFLRPRIVVEAGTYKAHLCCAVANIFRILSHEGHIFTADTIDYGLPCALRTTPEGQRMSPYITFFHGDYLDMLKGVPGPIDLAYIDASNLDDPHTRMRHATITFEMMAPGALMFVDDTAALDWDDARVFRERANIYLAPHRGLSMIQKPYEG